MEPFRFNEALNRYYEGDGKFRDGYDEEGAPLWQPMFRLQLTMQLAQEVVTNHTNIEGRIDEYPTQAQLLFDTLYYVRIGKDSTSENPVWEIEQIQFQKIEDYYG